MTAVWIALAGGLGAGTRFLVDSWVRPHVPKSLPWSTHLINASGSLLLGLVIGAGTGDPWHTIVGVGFLGGYTTFSTASVESAHLALDRRYGAAFANSMLMIIASVSAAAVGYALGRML